VGVTRKLAQAGCLLGFYHHIRGNLTKAISLYSEVLSISVGGNNQAIQTFGWAGQASSMMLIGDYESSAVYLKKAESLMDKDNWVEKYLVMGLMALAFYKNNNSSLADRYCTEVLHELSTRPISSCFLLEPIACCCRMLLLEVSHLRDDSY
jgi:hypothetical protein